MTNSKKVFFGFDVACVWPQALFSQKEILENERHITLVFLGEIDYLAFEKTLTKIPLPNWTLGLLGEFDKCIFLPFQNPRLVAWEIDFWENSQNMQSYFSELKSFLQKNGYAKEHGNSFLPHITVSRDLKNPKGWEKVFQKKPLFVKSFNLYESFARSHYKTLWKKDFVPPLEEIEHTADIAYKIRGIDFNSLQRAAFFALSMRFSGYYEYNQMLTNVDNVNDIVINLNNALAQLDAEKGAPFKAVSFHGEIARVKNYLEWEMIVDV